MTDIPDITGDIGPLYVECKVPMYSFARPSTLLWQGVYAGLREKGLTHRQAVDVLQSKAVRHMLDSKGTTIERLGKRLAKELK